MPEHKKRTWICKSVTSRSCDELSNQLEDLLNKYEEEGYNLHLEPIIFNGSEFHGVIIGYLAGHEEESHGAHRTVAEILDRTGSAIGLSVELTAWLMERVISRVSAPTWEAAEKEAPKIIPEAVKGLTPLQIDAYAKECETLAADHEKKHTSAECRMPQTFRLFANLMREAARLQLQ